MFCAGDTEVLRPGEMRRFEARGKAFVLARSKKGEYYAARNICPHQGVDLSEGVLTGRTLPSKLGCYEYVDDGEILRCGRHAYEFDIKTGRSWFNPDRVRIKTYAVQIEDGRVLVDI
jgi:nitrite reductase (NADH) small subunit